MSIYDLFLFIFATYGITFGLKDSKLFSKPRNFLAERYDFFLSLFQCPYCVGFHAGYLAFFLVGTYPSSSVPLLCRVLAHAFAGSCVAGLLEALLLRLESKTENS